MNFNEIFFKETLCIKDRPLGKVKYYAIRVEFEFCGSTDIYSFLWVLNPARLTENTINEIVDFLDSAVCGNLPSEQEESHLYQLVKTFQISFHSKTYRKCKNTKFCFKFGGFLIDKTIIAIPMQKNNLKKFNILSRRSSILRKV